MHGLNNWFTKYKQVISIKKLNLRYLKNRRETFASNNSINVSDASQSFDQRPVIVFQKSLSEDNSTQSYQNDNSGHRFTEHAPTGILSKPCTTSNLCTASTWLGKRVRQQQKLKQQQVINLFVTKNFKIKLKHFFRTNHIMNINLLIYHIQKI